MLCGIPDKLVGVVKMLYQDSSARVLHDGELSEAFRVYIGVKQGCVLSPFLFSIAFDWFTTKTTVEERPSVDFFKKTRGFRFCR